jgi:threonine dehydrogenase-like Zn-dependent dehydrogenase
MAAVVKYGFGAGETELREMPVPRVGPHDVLLEVKAAGVCGTDLALDAGKADWLLRPPVTLGHEFAGVVAKVGGHVTAYRPGDRIVSENTGYVCGLCPACNRGDYLLCEERLGIGYGMDGGFARYVRIPGEILAKYPGCLFQIPENMSFEEAAIMDPCANAYRAVVQDAALRSGEDIVIFGLGPLGLCCVQMARASGAGRVVCAGRGRDEKRFSLARKLGADLCLRADAGDPVRALRAASNGFAAAVDCAGSHSILALLFEVLPPGARIVKVGMDDTPADFSLDPMLRLSLTLKGHLGYDWDCWQNAFRLYEKGSLDILSMITHRMPLAQYLDAFGLVRAQEAIKVILRP